MNFSTSKLQAGIDVRCNSRHVSRCRATSGGVARPAQSTQIFSPLESRGRHRGSERSCSTLAPLNAAGGEIYQLSSGEFFSTIGLGFLWVVVSCSSLYATWSMVQAFLSAAKIVNRRQDKPKREEEERQERIDKLFGKK